MAEHQILALIKSIAVSAMLVSLGIYQGAAVIAIVAALSRLAYTDEQSSVALFSRFFVMSLSISMLMVHVGLWLDLDKELLIVISGISAFLCREVLEVIISSKDILLKKLLAMIK
ncbi:MAG: hypothetical protein IBX55_08925 [Methyloprofundus sp.]|nr:hypothetical protein [Methyloprofundus sp.]